MSESNSLKTIWLVASGTRGDVQPYLAVALELKRRGYEVLVLTGRDFADFCQSLGLEAVAIRPSNKEVFYQNPQVLKGMQQGDLSASMKGLVQLNQVSAPMVYQKLNELISTRGLPDLVLCNTFIIGAAWYLAMKHQVPFLEFMAQAPIFHPKRMQLGLPTLPFGLHYYLLFNVMCGTAYDLNLALHKHLKTGLEQYYTRQQAIAFWKQPDRPQIILFSPTLAPVLYPNPQPYQRFVGSTVIASQDQTQHLEYFGGTKENDNQKSEFQQMQDFLQKEGSKPIYMGWGSMMGKSPQQLCELCARTVYETRQRAIIHKGEAGLSMELLVKLRGSIPTDVFDYAQQNLLFVASAPHEWLFPRVACTIHHGGAGTLLAALRAGVPTIITPVFGDQLDHAYVVNQFGVGVGFETIRLKDLSHTKLVEAVEKVLNDSALQERAAALGAKLRQEDGVTRAAEEVELFWNEYVATGEFYKRFPGKAPDRSYTRLAWIGSATVVVVAVAMYSLGRPRFGKE